MVDCFKFLMIISFLVIIKKKIDFCFLLSIIMQDPKILNKNEIDEKYDKFIETFISKYKQQEETTSNNERLADPRLIRISDLTIMLQEFSRRSLNWPILKIGKLIPDGNYYKLENPILDELSKSRIELPMEVISLLYINQECLILAGGSCVDLLMGRHVKDYDLFCIKQRPKISFNENDILETMHSLSTITYPKIQIIKRIYDCVEQVIGKNK